MSISLKQHSGFTLVELAVSMSVIGLLIAGVLQGKALIDGARVTSIGAKVEEFDNAINNFVALYDELPGDMTNAQTKIPACAQSTATCLYDGSPNNGNGNGQIDGISNITAADNSVEGIGLWEHLVAAGMLNETQINPGTTNIWGVTHPSSPIGGGFVAMFNPSIPGANPGDDAVSVGTGHFFRLSRLQTGAGTVGTSMLTPSMAATLDRKMDDGVPNQGRVLAIGASCFATGIYTVNNNTRNCDMLFGFR